VRDGASNCRFVKATIAARAPLPAEWSQEHAFALVRRGVVVRTRAELDGVSIAIDCVGPRSLVPLHAHGTEVGYAASDTLVCLYPRHLLRQAVSEDAALGLEVVEGLQKALDRVERLAEARGHAMAEQRIARVLAVLSEHQDHLHGGIQQRDLARLAGVRHESVCRFLAKLTRDGTIHRDDGLLFIDHPGNLSSERFAHPRAASPQFESSET